MFPFPQTFAENHVCNYSLELRLRSLTVRRAYRDERSPPPGSNPERNFLMGLSGSNSQSKAPCPKPGTLRQSHTSQNSSIDPSEFPRIPGSSRSFQSGRECILSGVFSGCQRKSSGCEFSSV